MLMYNNYMDYESNSTLFTRIDSYKMVEDIHFLYGMKKMDLPLEINRNWHPEVFKIFGQLLSGERSRDNGCRIPRSIYDFDFYIYNLKPIDDWGGYYQVFLEDLIQESKWLNLIYHAFSILKGHSNWELDIRQGPFVSMLPGTERAFSHWVVLLKQDNNGDTFAVSRYHLDYLSDDLIKCHIVDKPKK